MKAIALTVAAFTCAAVLGWPYLYLYRLDRAVAAHDLTELAELVDVAAVRAGVKGRLAERVEGAIGGESGSMLGWIQEGVKQIGARAVDISVDLKWILDTLAQRRAANGELSPNTLIQDTSYAFYENWDRFLVRVGEPDHHPIHIRMALRAWRWRVVAISD